MLAARTGRATVVEYLVRFGADVKKVGVITRVCPYDVMCAGVCTWLCMHVVVSVSVRSRVCTCISPMFITWLCFAQRTKHGATVYNAENKDVLLALERGLKAKLAGN